MKARYIPPDLKPGDSCWLLRGTLLYEVTIAEVNTYLEGERSEFKLYKIACEHAGHLERDSQHRSDLFLRPAERRQLIEQIDSNIDSLEYMKKELEDEACEECDGTGQVLDAPGNVLDGRAYLTACETCKGTGMQCKENTQ